ncbi:MAG: DUF2071 domain-containing protein [Verrucomicrobia bacterium]|nr:DUF2071 domain-containing protein [Verrucomicrobiota bacterium]
MTALTLAQRLAERELPSTRRVMHQRWENLLFLHWRLPVEVVQQSLPKGLQVDTFDGSAWVGVVPFFMRGIRPVFSPALPWVSNFLELNLRTYVRDADGQPGVWFYSLDCNQPVAVWLARTFFSLPYQPARMTAQSPTPGRIIYTSQRRGDDHESRFDYELARETTVAEPGTLEFFLVERYRLFTQTRGGLRSGRVYHQPYLLAPVNVREWDTRLFPLNGFADPLRPPDHAIASPGVRVSIHALDQRDK